MCPECEKSLPNQIVFDKIESIIRLMQDEQNGLPVKTAKSFMSKIPSVFTGIDLVQWMMRNLKLEDLQEAIHLANLIASHGYIFPIEDHTLSIKNDCTFYRFQTPCLWPSNNSEPENTDYAVYLCKRTMQGKTRLELADYEAENLARLQKMFSRKWEFIFMQAESQAKVDKKRDKLERKVLDSQERAFWDVYRPVPGCVNTTEMDIKKACRLSKSAKRCSECQKVAAALSVPSGSTATSASGTIILPVSSAVDSGSAQDIKSNSSDSTHSNAPVPSASTGKSVQIVEKVKVDGFKHHHHAQAVASTSAGFEDREISRVCPHLAGNRANSSAGTETITTENQETKIVVLEKKTILDPSDNQSLALAKKAMEEGKIITSCLKHPVSTTNSSALKEHEKQIPKTVSAARPAVVGHQHHHHQHPHHSHHHHHHHHHHHPHSHQHGHHHHHHQCAHHKHNQQQQHHKLSMPTESILTTTVAAASANWTASGEEESKQGSTTTLVADEQKEENCEEIESEIKLNTNDGRAQTTNQRMKLTSGGTNTGGVCRAQTWSKKRSVGSVDCHHSHLMRTPSIHTSMSDASRRKSDCNRLLSMSEDATTTATTTTTTKPVEQLGASVSASSSPSPASLSSRPNLDLSTDNANSAAAERPASACCSVHNSAAGEPSKVGQASEPIEAHSAQCKSHRSMGGSGGQQQQQQTMLRKGSLNIIARPSSTGPEFIDERERETCPPALSSNSMATSTIAIELASQRKSGSLHTQQHQQQQQQHSPLKGAKSLLCGQSTSDFSGTDRQHIGDLERELEALKVRLDRRIGGVKMSKVTQSYLSYFKQWADYDPFIAQPIPSNPWISDSTELWDSERQTKDVHCRRVRRWAFSLKELLSDPAGREQFHRFLEKEFSAENLKFWDAVQELKRVHSRDVARRVEAIWTEYLAQDANCPINIDSKSYETSKKNMAKNKNNRYIFDEAAGHVYQLMKNDSYPRYLRSEMYKDYKEASEKKRNQVAFDVFKPQITTLKHKFNF